MPEILHLSTERNDVTLRQLASPEDDQPYWEAVEANRVHLSQFGDVTSEKYQTPDDVTKARLNAGSKIRMGIWDGDTFVGTINATPSQGEVEIGYWLDARHTGHGYMTVALRSLTAYLRPQYQRVFAEVRAGNNDSIHVLERSGYIPVDEVETELGKTIVFEPADQAKLEH